MGWRGLDSPGSCVAQTPNTLSVHNKHDVGLLCVLALRVGSLCLQVCRYTRDGPSLIKCCELGDTDVQSCVLQFMEKRQSTRVAAAELYYRFPIDECMCSAAIVGFKVWCDC